MDLVAIARARRGRAVGNRAAAWLHRLAAGNDGARAAHRHLAGEDNLPLHAQGLGAVDRLLGRLPAASDALGWYLAQLADEGLTLTCQGPAAAPDFPDRLCRLAKVVDVALYLAQPAQTPILADPPFSEEANEGLRAWAEERLCGASLQDALEATRLVRGRLPVSFVAAEEDVSPFLPGASVERLREILGLPLADFPGQAHVLLSLSRQDAGGTRVPTAFDAGDHPYFQPPGPGAGCGRTFDRGRGTEGAREVVVPPFLAASIHTVHCVTD